MCDLEKSSIFSIKYGYIREERSEVESYPYPVEKG